MTGLSKQPTTDGKTSKGNNYKAYKVHTVINQKTMCNVATKFAQKLRGHYETDVTFSRRQYLSLTVY